MLWLCLKLNRLPIEVFTKHTEDSIELAVITEDRHPKVLAYNSKAADLGVKSGMNLSMLYEIAPNITLCKRRYYAELAKLREIATWALRFTSEVTISEPNSLLLEIEGSLRLFKGIKTIVREIRNGIKTMNLTCTINVAPTPLSAQYLNDYGIEKIIKNKNELFNYLRKLPITIIEKNPQSISLFSQMGIYYIFDLEKLPKDGIIQRFGKKLIENIEKALGNSPDPQKKFVPQKNFSLLTNLPYFIHNSENLLYLLNFPLQKITRYLSEKNIGLTRLEIILKNNNYSAHTINIAISQPSRNKKHILFLIREKLKNAKIKFSFNAFSTTITETSILDNTTKSILPTCDFNDTPNIKIIEKIRTRLGRNSLYAISLNPDFRPELAWNRSEPEMKISKIRVELIRPFWLLPNPKFIEMRNEKLWINGELSILDGPERIESGWWDHREIKRDYFIARNTQGSHFWIYREYKITNIWHLHGIFS